jgi:hypothetical protein
MVQGWPKQKVSPSLKNTQHKQKRAGGMLQVVESLPSKYKAELFKPQDQKKKKKIFLT